MVKNEVFRGFLEILDLQKSCFGTFFSFFEAFWAQDPEIRIPREKIHRVVAFLPPGTLEKSKEVNKTMISRIP